MTKFYSNIYKGYNPDVNLLAISNILTWQILNILTIEKALFNRSLKDDASSGIAFIYLLIIVALYVFVAKGLSELEEKFKNVDKKYQKIANWVIIFYWILTPLLFFYVLDIPIIKFY